MAEDKAIKKTQAISKAQRTMLIVVAAASVVVGFAVVGSIFLIQRGMFNQKVIDATQDTAKTLETNVSQVDTLSSSVRELEANTALRSSMTNSDGNALRVIADALPSVNNPLALGSSVMTRILTLGTAVRVNSFTLDNVSATPTLPPATGGTGSGSASTAMEPDRLQSITFRFEVEGSNDDILKSLQNLERSIRQIDITTMNVEFANTGNLRMSVQATAYTVDPPSINLRTKEITTE